MGLSVFQTWFKNNQGCQGLCVLCVGQSLTHVSTRSFKCLENLNRVTYVSQCVIIQVTNANVEGYVMLIDINDIWWANTPFYAWWPKHVADLNTLLGKWDTQQPHILRRATYKGKITEDNCGKVYECSKQWLSYNNCEHIERTLINSKFVTFLSYNNFCSESLLPYRKPLLEKSLNAQVNVQVAWGWLL